MTKAQTLLPGHFLFSKDPAIISFLCTTSLSIPQLTSWIHPVKYVFRQTRTTQQVERMQKPVLALEMTVEKEQAARPGLSIKYRIKKCM